MFRFYKNKKINHPSISIRQRDKRKWHNLPISHSKPKNDTFIVINDPHPKAKQHDKSYVRRYLRIDKRGVKGHPYKEYRLSKKSEQLIKKYLKDRCKKRWCKARWRIAQLYKQASSCTIIKSFLLSNRNTNKKGRWAE